MYQKFYKAVLCCMVMLVIVCNASAQTIAETKLGDVFLKTPQLPASLQQALEMYATASMEVTPADFRNALDETDHLHESILQSLFRTFEANLEKTKSYKSFLARVSPEEQKMIRDFATLQASWGEQAMYGFKVWIEYRPGGAKQSWTKINLPLSNTARNDYLQLLQIEKSLNWSLFLEEAHDKEGWMVKDEALDDVNKQLSADLEAVPTKKVKFAEGSDVMVDMKDPDKSIDVLKKSEAKTQQVFKQGYDKQYLWWSENYNRIKSAAIKLDDLLTVTNYGAGLKGNDRQLMAVMADVQARIVGMLHHLINIGTKIIGYAQLANMHKLMTEQSIESFKKMSSQ